MQPQLSHETDAPFVTASAASNDDALLNAAQARTQCGGVSAMCIWRWERDPRVNFPKPDIIINRRRYWYRATIRRWQSERTTQAP